ncbi:MAG: helix-turn-helix transcriptional regulator [Candidatus Dormibacteraeota bacterium]|nr:helix-turn-helix transcriptional regulator [Candidatus Dormibacteraeota bacterium]
MPIGSRFEDYVRELEKKLEPKDREALERLRAHYTVASQLIELRKEKGISQQQLAELSGVYQSEISRIERGSANPSQATLEAIARVFGRTVGFMTPAA